MKPAVFVKNVSLPGNDGQNRIGSPMRLAIILRILLLLHWIALLCGLGVTVYNDSVAVSLYPLLGAMLRPFLLAFFLCWFPPLLLWVYRINRISRQVCDPPPATTPGWAVALFFVPILMLFRPCQVMADLWRCNLNQKAAIIYVWWLTWLGALILYLLSSGWESSGDLHTAMQYLISGFAADLVSIACLWYIVGKITAANMSLSLVETP